MSKRDSDLDKAELSASERQQAHFDSIAATYIAARKDARHLLVKELIWAEFFRRAKLDLPPDARVLEAMCGIGEGRFILNRHLGIDTQWNGFDFSPNMVAAAQSIHGEDRVSLQDATTYTPDHPIDLGLIIGGLHHVHWKAAEVVANIASAIVPGGYFIAFEPTHANPLFGYIRDRIYKKNAFFDQETERAFHVSELSGFFKSANLEHVYDLNFGLSAYTLFYNPDAFPILNRGPLGLVKTLWDLDKIFASNSIGRFFSFGTITLWRKPL